MRNFKKIISPAHAKSLFKTYLGHKSFIIYPISKIFAAHLYWSNIYFFIITKQKIIRGEFQNINFSTVTELSL